LPPDNIRYEPTREKISDDPYSYAPYNEAHWRGDAPAWTFTDFFELLKDQYRELKFIPQNSRDVIDVENGLGPGTETIIAMQQRIFRERRWPDLERYDKEKCLEALQTAMEQQYPEHAGYWLDD
jgi:hypothetical protein